MLAAEGIKRKKEQHELDRMELESVEFHEKVAEGYRRLAREYEERIFRVDAMLSVEEIREIIRKKVGSMINLSDKL